MLRIDLKDILERTVSDEYGDLVTRRTGQAVRQEIERDLARTGDGQAAAIDFGTVRCLDLSCADEIVGRLLREQGAVRPFVLLNVTPAHREALQFVLERHRLAVVVRDTGGAFDIVGALPDAARRVFGALTQTGTAAPEDLARRLDLSPDAAREALEDLLERGLVIAHAGTYGPPVT
ncbi:MAG TPA: hypothetical protein VJL31_17190 [Gemmatimonadales bacterium]|jgi:DNA-binding transcriptional ArsR family regulator|nr:hypothetical protein [Gemmatimonadales bacterium]